METVRGWVTDVIATLGIFVHFWLPSLAGVSQTSALLLPIAGLAWLIIQMWFRITGRDRD